MPLANTKSTGPDPVRGPACLSLRVWYASVEGSLAVGVCVMAVFRTLRCSSHGLKGRAQDLVATTRSRNSCSSWASVARVFGR